MGSSSRRWLNPSTHSSVANSTASRDRHGPRRWITSALSRPLIVSASALSKLSPTLPTEGSMPAAAKGSVRARANLKSGYHLLWLLTVKHHTSCADRVLIVRFGASPDRTEHAVD